MTVSEAHAQIPINGPAKSAARGPRLVRGPPPNTRSTRPEYNRYITTA